MVFISNYQSSDISMSQAVQKIICQLTSYVLDHELLSSTWYDYHTNSLSIDNTTVAPWQEASTEMLSTIHRRYNGATIAKCPSPYGGTYGDNRGTIIMEQEMQSIIATLSDLIQLDGLRGTATTTSFNDYLSSIMQLLYLYNTGSNSNNEESWLREQQRQQLLPLLHIIIQSIGCTKQNGGGDGGSNHIDAATKTSERDSYFDHTYNDEEDKEEEDKHSFSEGYRSPRQTVRPLWRVPCVSMSRHSYSSASSSSPLSGCTPYCHEHRWYNSERTSHTSVCCV
ncbi:hypothetical protein BDF22DRAFT_741984 [Syncephalis plumigaleata]|nr:hypothetical protein BDF22DRAFT_741984 [Syncephalis plumigaleata]